MEKLVTAVVHLCWGSPRSSASSRSQPSAVADPCWYLPPLQAHFSAGRFWHSGFAPHVELWVVFSPLFITFPQWLLSLSEAVCDFLYPNAYVSSSLLVS